MCDHLEEFTKELLSLLGHEERKLLSIPVLRLSFTVFSISMIMHPKTYLYLN